MDTKMKIGFIKFGLKTYFNKGRESNQGSNHELVSVFKMFEERGHQCFMVSNSDKPEYSFESTGQDIHNLDYIFVFNGFAPNTLVSKMNMFQQPIAMIKKINEFKGPWAYFWTDVRYDLRKLDVITNKNVTILSQEPANYAHLEKLILIGKEIRPFEFKDYRLKILMNYTQPARAKNALKIVESVGGEIIGDWKKKADHHCEGDINATDVQQYLDKVKYSWNQTVDPWWISQKYWEMILSNVICFHQASDWHYLQIPKDSFQRVDGPEIMSEKIRMLERDSDKYSQLIEEQQRSLKKEYFNGDFMYNIIMAKLTLGGLKL